jgi:hypothetical protein
MRNNITIYPDDKLKKKIEEDAEKENRSVNKQVLSILLIYYEENEKKKD